VLTYKVIYGDCISAFKAYTLAKAAQEVFIATGRAVG
jgi:hypothetical protein